MLEQRPLAPSSSIGDVATLDGTRAHAVEFGVRFGLLDRLDDAGLHLVQAGDVGGTVRRRVEVRVELGGESRSGEFLRVGGRVGEERGRVVGEVGEERRGEVT